MRILFDALLSALLSLLFFFVDLDSDVFCLLDELPRVDLIVGADSVSSSSDPDPDFSPFVSSASLSTNSRASSSSIPK